MLKLFSKVLLLLLPCLMSAAPGEACGGTADLPGPKLRFNPPPFLRPVAVQVKLSPRQTTVSYTILNTYGRDWMTAMDFRLPPKEMEEHFGGTWYSDASYRELKVEVNGEPLEYNRRARSFYKGREVTQDLRAAGLDPQLTQQGADGGPMERRLTTEGELELFRRLHDEGVCQSQEPPSLEGEEGYMCFPGWSTLNTYWWEQVFPAGQETTISYTYLSNPGGDGFEKDTADQSAHTLSTAGYADLSELFSAAGLKFEEVMPEFRTGEPGHCMIGWYRVPLGQEDLPWSEPIGEFTFEVTMEDDKNEDNRYATAIEPENVIMMNLRGQVHRGTPEMKVTARDIFFDKPLVIMSFRNVGFAN
ncbi:hypothetical protein C4J81_19040 (plasmid) [Deltaproteobacteria bacterium Smac51]|nr:hypothetical protein C4J81_19040 [Deltaproteobacteria bacterium Smac51]